MAAKNIEYHRNTTIVRSNPHISGEKKRRWNGFAWAAGFLFDGRARFGGRAIPDSGQGSAKRS
jgi:hypothetical protein